MAYEVRDVSGRRFEITTPSGVAWLDYRREDGTLRLTHTQVPNEEEGRGLGGALVRHAMERAREEALEVIPTCPFAASWIRRHPEYQDLVSERAPGR